MDNHDTTGTVEDRLSKLERVIVLQQQLIDRLGIVGHGHHQMIEALAQIITPAAVPPKSVPISTLN